MSDTPHDTPAAPKKKWRTWLSYLLIPVLVYFGNVEVQSYLGQKAIDSTGLDIFPLEQALAKAKQENKQVLADMSAIWCPSCRRLDKEVFANPQVQETLLKDYVFSRIEYESKEGEAFMQKYQVKGFPTLLVLDDAGALVRKLPLTFNPDDFITLLAKTRP